MSSLIGNVARKERRNTAANWTSDNPTPLDGEWCLETDTKKLKIGDGSTAWTSLLYSAVTTGLVTGTKYDSGWVANSDWTNALFTITHSLSANLSDIIIRFLISTDGADNNAFEPRDTLRVRTTSTSGVQDMGYTINQVSDNSFTIQTGIDGVGSLDASGDLVFINTQSWYYKVVVIKLDIQS